MSNGPKGTIVTLTQEEMDHAIKVANDIIADSIKHKRKDNHGYGYYPKSYKDEKSRQGFMAEKAVAKLMGLPWPPNNGGFKNADAGLDIQVKSTHYPNGRLIVRHDATPSHRYVLVICDKIPHFRVVGWMFARDAMQDKWKAAPDPLRPVEWFVPQYELQPVSELMLTTYTGNSTGLVSVGDVFDFVE
jgi:hypothetical protein